MAPWSRTIFGANLSKTVLFLNPLSLPLCEHGKHNATPLADKAVQATRPIFLNRVGKRDL